MHELAVTQQVLDIVLQHAEEAEAKQVQRIELVIGDMTSFVDDAVQFCFDALSQGTIAEEAELSFRRIPVTIRCRECGAVFKPDDIDLTCPECGAYAGEVIAGREFYIDHIEVE